MERIELFDKYINHQLSDMQRSEFDARLQSDEEFASDFKVYLLTVDGICQEARQDNLDFGMAMKSISKEQLKGIIGRRAAVLPQKEPSSKSIWFVRFRPWMWQVASIAAVVVIAFIVVYKTEKNARYSVDNAVFTCVEMDINQARGGSDVFNIQYMSENELINIIPILIENYHSAKSLDEIADNGFTLAMAYLRVHDRGEAKSVLNALIDKFGNNPDYADYVSKWQSILTVLK